METTPSGLKFEDEKVGEGASPARGKPMHVRLCGRL